MENQSLGTEDKLANTISDGSTVITPQLILGWEAAQDSRNVIHSIIGKAEPDVTLKPANLRTGTLQLLFLTAAEATSARVMLIQALPFLIESDETFLDNFHFVVSGAVSSVLEDETRKLWTLSVDFQEVTA